MAGDGRSSRRTIVLSDAHGYPSLIEDALAHACFEPARDRLIFAGDLVDRGLDSARCLELIESAAETALFGNHDVCAMLGSPLEPTVGGDDLSGPLVERFRGDRRWRFAAAVGGVLVTHAGLSSEVLGMIGGEHALDAGFLADEIDRWARDEMESALALGYLDDEGLLGMSGRRPAHCSRRIRGIPSSQSASRLPTCPARRATGPARCRGMRRCSRVTSMRRLPPARN